MDAAHPGQAVEQENGEIIDGVTQRQPSAVHATGASRHASRNSDRLSPSSQVQSSYSQNTTPPRVFKVIVLGDSSVGKTCLTYRFCARDFLIQTEATIGVDFRERLLELTDRNSVSTQKVKLQLWDTAGQERFRRSMVPHYYRNAHAVVFVYDVTRPDTFDSLETWIKESDHYLGGQANADIPRCVVGNKIDLVSQLSSTERYVPTEVAQRFADIHSMPLFETSAREDSQMDNVDAIFITLAHKLKDSKPFISRHASHDSDIKLSVNETLGPHGTVRSTSSGGCC